MPGHSAAQPVATFPAASGMEDGEILEPLYAVSTTVHRAAPRLPPIVASPANAHRHHSLPHSQHHRLVPNPHPPRPDTTRSTSALPAAHPILNANLNHLNPRAEKVATRRAHLPPPADVPPPTMYHHNPVWSSFLPASLRQPQQPPPAAHAPPPPPATSRAPASTSMPAPPPSAPSPSPSLPPSLPPPARKVAPARGDRHSPAVFMHASLPMRSPVLPPVPQSFPSFADAFPFSQPQPISDVPPPSPSQQPGLLHPLQHSHLHEQSYQRPHMYPPPPPLSLHPPFQHTPPQHSHHPHPSHLPPQAPPRAGLMSSLPPPPTPTHPSHSPHHRRPVPHPPPQPLPQPADFRLPYDPVLTPHARPIRHPHPASVPQPHVVHSISSTSTGSPAGAPPPPAADRNVIVLDDDLYHPVVHNAHLHHPHHIQHNYHNYNHNHNQHLNHSQNLPAHTDGRSLSPPIMDNHHVAQLHLTELDMGALQAVQFSPSTRHLASPRPHTDDDSSHSSGQRHAHEYAHPSPAPVSDDDDSVIVVSAHMRGQPKASAVVSVPLATSRSDDSLAVSAPTLEKTLPQQQVLLSAVPTDMAPKPVKPVQRRSARELAELRLKVLKSMRRPNLPATPTATALVAPRLSADAAPQPVVKIDGDAVKEDMQAVAADVKAMAQPEANLVAPEADEVGAAPGQTDHQRIVACRRRKFQEMLSFQMSDSDMDDEDPYAPFFKTGPTSRRGKLSVDEQIEDMKIRVVRLGKCPSELLIVTAGMQDAKRRKLRSSSPPHAQWRGGPPVTLSGNGAAHADAVKQSPLDMAQGVKDGSDDGHNDNGRGGDDGGNVVKQAVPTRTSPTHVNLTVAGDNGRVAVVASVEKLPPARSPDPVLPPSVIALDTPKATGETEPSKKVPDGTLQKNTEETAQIGQTAEKKMKSADDIQKTRNGAAMSTDMLVLRRRIAMLEKSRQSKKMKKEYERSRKETEEGRSCKSGHIASIGSANQYVVSGPVRDNDKSNNVKAVAVFGGTRARYYDDEAAKRINVEKPGDAAKRGSDDSGSSAEVAVPKTAGKWNERQELSGKRSGDDEGDAGQLEDLKTELEEQKRQLSTFQDYTTVMQRASVTLAEASAKLSFKRSRLESVRKDMKQVELEVQEAEQDYEKIYEAATALRSSMKASNSDVTFPELDMIAPSSTQDTKKDNASDDCEGVADMSDADAAGGGEGTSVGDIIMRASPFSAAGDGEYNSCLSAFRAFLYRIPHRAQAKDRKSVSVMSLTWTHGLDVNQVICPRELRSHCVDKKCTYQHLGAMKGGMGHALSIIDHIEANMSTAKMRLAEKAVVRARLDIYSGALLCGVRVAPS